MLDRRQGLAVVYHDLRLEPGAEVLVTEHDPYATQGSLRLAAQRAGASVRKIDERPENVTDEEVERASRAVRALRR